MAHVRVAWQRIGGAAATLVHGGTAVADPLVDPFASRRARRWRRAGSAALIASALALSACSALSPNQIAVNLVGAPEVGANITPAERDQIVAQHNLFRAEVRQPPLTWDPAIATGAQQWAEAKQADGIFAHSPNDSRPGLGENLAGGEVKDATIRLADGERELYQANPQMVDQPPGNWTAWGHYSQIVWSSTARVGCGFAPPGKLAFGLVVCRYGPPGNFSGQFPYPPDTVLVAQPGLKPVVPQAETPPGEPPAADPPADTPPADTLPPVDATPADAPPAEAPPAEAPPADAPPAEAPPAEAPPADAPPADAPRAP
jgi:hypothetical protein